MQVENAVNLTRASTSNFSKELELENLQLLICVHSNDTVIAIDRDKLSSVALIVAVQHFDLVILLRLDWREIVVSNRNSLLIN
jgi:hypothetical protein